MATAYIYDALLYQPEIPVKYEKRIENAIYFVLDYVLDSDEVPAFRH